MCQGRSNFPHSGGKKTPQRGRNNFPTLAGKISPGQHSVKVTEVSPMIGEEEYLLIQDLAQEQEIAEGKVNISALSRDSGYDRKTIRKYLFQCQSPGDLRIKRRKSK